MLNIVHVSAAAAIVTTIANPWISLPLALVSHIALDTVPHWNWSPGRSMVGKLASVNDGMLAIILTLALAIYMDRSWVMLAAGSLSMLPDVIQAPYHFLGWKPGWLSRFIDWERRRQKWAWMRPWMGLMTQVIVLGLSLWIVFS